MPINEDTFHKAAVRKAINSMADLIPEMQQRFMRPTEILAKAWLGPIQLQALGTLGREKSLPLSEMVSRLKISKQQLTPIVDKLESSGFVRREAYAADRRSVQISLTDEGTRYLEGIRESFMEMTGQLIAQLETRDLETLNEALKTVREIFRKLP